MEREKKNGDIEEERSTANSVSVLKEIRYIYSKGGDDLVN